MKIYICDNKEAEEKFKIKKEDILIVPDNNIKNCIGCFSCWTKHPMECCIKGDNINKLPEKIIKADEIIIITKIKNGCYSSFVKKVLERIIGIVKPYFTIRDKEIHHKLIKKEKLKLNVFVYGESTALEEKIFQSLCKRNQKNLNTEDIKIRKITAFNYENGGDIIDNIS
ncbi:iron-sulfur flavoprotein [Clostridium sp. CAG:1219]|nr:iron-sulfur flavoprotein [Clostridium sp. CAG:1219]